MGNICFSLFHLPFSLYFLRPLLPMIATLATSVDHDLSRTDCEGGDGAQILYKLKSICSIVLNSEHHLHYIL